MHNRENKRVHKFLSVNIHLEKINAMKEKEKREREKERERQFQWSY